MLSVTVLAIASEEGSGMVGDNGGMALFFRDIGAERDQDGEGDRRRHRACKTRISLYYLLFVD